MYGVLFSLDRAGKCFVLKTISRGQCNSKGELCHDHVANKIKRRGCECCAIGAIAVSIMGESAVKLHMRSAKHKNNAVMNMRGKQLTKPSNIARGECVMVMCVNCYYANAATTLTQ